MVRPMIDRLISPAGVGAALIANLGCAIDGAQPGDGPVTLTTTVDPSPLVPFGIDVATE